MIKTPDSSCSATLLSVNLEIALKYYVKTVKAGDFYIVGNSKTVLYFFSLNNNHENCVRRYSTYDFQSIYTHIPHDQLKSNLRILCNELST